MRRRRNGGRIPPSNARVTRRATRAFQLRSQGKTYEEISYVIQSEFNMPRYCRRMALADCDHALAIATAENTKTLHLLRGQELVRYDDYLDKIYRRIELGDVFAVDAALKISVQRAKILGLYAPVEIKIQQIVKQRIEAELTLFFEALENKEEIPEYVKEYLYDIAENVRENLEEKYSNLESIEMN